MSIVLDKKCWLASTSCVLVVVTNIVIMTTKFVSHLPNWAEWAKVNKNKHIFLDIGIIWV